MYDGKEGEEGKEEGEERSERGGTYCNTRTVLFPIPLVASLSALTSAALALSSLCLLFSLLSSSRLPMPPLLALLSVVPINWHNDRIRRERDEKRGEDTCLYEFVACCYTGEVLRSGLRVS